MESHSYCTRCSNSGHTREDCPKKSTKTLNEIYHEKYIAKMVAMHRRENSELYCRWCKSFGHVFIDCAGYIEYDEACNEEIDDSCAAELYCDHCEIFEHDFRHCPDVIAFCDNFNKDIRATQLDNDFESHNLDDDQAHDTSDDLGQELDLHDINDYDYTEYVCTQDLENSDSSPLDFDDLNVETFEVEHTSDCEVENPRDALDSLREDVCYDSPPIFDEYDTSDVASIASFDTSEGGDCTYFEDEMFDSTLQPLYDDCSCIDSFMTSPSNELPCRYDTDTEVEEEECSVGDASDTYKTLEIVDCTSHIDADFETPHREEFYKVEFESLHREELAAKVPIKSSSCTLRYDFVLPSSFYVYYFNVVTDMDFKDLPFDRGKISKQFQVIGRLLLCDQDPFLKRIYDLSFSPRPPD